MFKKTLTLTMGALMLAPIALGAQTAFADEAPTATNSANSKVSIKVEAGGLDMDAQDVDFGTVKLGTKSTDLPKYDENVLQARNYTGVEQKITVKDTNYDSHEATINYSVGRGTALTSESEEVGTISKLAGSRFNDSTSIGSFWGDNPTAGDYTANLTWTATPSAQP